MQHNLPTAMEMLNALDGVSQEQLQIIIDELRKAAANDDDASSSEAIKQPITNKQKEPILEL